MTCIPIKVWQIDGMLERGIQWNLSIADTLETDKNVLISEEFLILVNAQNVIVYTETLFPDHSLVFESKRMTTQ